MKTAIDAVLTANQTYAPDYDPALVSPRPRLHLAVVTCMDTRLSYKALGLRPGDAHMIRNAGGIVTSDALRSFLILWPSDFDVSFIRKYNRNHLLSQVREV